MKWVAHVYLTNFFTTIQLGLKPELAGEPLVILKHNRALDADSMAADLGVKLRSTRRHAYQVCPNGMYMEYREENYRSAATKVLGTCLEYTPVIEPVTENEFFLELAGPHSPDQVVRELTQKLVPWYCSGLSIGIGANKLLAKLTNMALNAGRVQPSQVMSEENTVGKYFWLSCSK